MKTAIIFAAIFGFLGVALGAFGAHALKDKFKEPKYAKNWETAVSYQFTHTFAIAVTGILIAINGEAGVLTWALSLFVAGIVIFSGSLYVLSLTGIKKLGAITPIGGVCMLAGWVCLLVSVL
jgi:uncharacterized membrane protein YgdD (TMEM256/DUF423 family)